METHEETDRESKLAAEVQAQAEQIAELQNAIGETCELLGHSGNDGGDLHDAVGQIERLLNDQDRDGVPLTGLAERLRVKLCLPTARQAIVVLYREPRDKASNSAWGAVLCTHFGIDVAAIRREVFDSGTSK